MLFASFGLKITEDCIELSYQINANQHCIDKNNSMIFLVNGKPIPNINLYEIKHNGDQLDFSYPQFQIQSKYIHFENDNSYLIHKHATDVPLDMLFASFGLKITEDCIELSYQINANQHCIDKNNSMIFLVNGKPIPNINLYEIKHNDRILISFGNSEFILEHLEYLEGLEIHDIPKINKIVPGKDISV